MVNTVTRHKCIRSRSIPTSVTAWAEINLNAVRHNVRELQRRAGRAQLAAVVKADGYGHGAETIARAALEAGAPLCAVFSVPEAIHLRESGIERPILVLGPILADDAPQIARLQLTVIVDSAETARALDQAAAAAGTVVDVHLNLDSGMQRFGLAHEDALELSQFVRGRAHLRLEGVMTHFPSASAPNERLTTDAFNAFLRATAEIDAPVRHAAASAALLRFPQTALDLVRPGIALYGIDPLRTGTAALQPVLSWRARLLAIRDVSAGESVSYGGRWTAPADARIGVVGAGYADGLRRSVSGPGTALIRGQHAPYAGAVCMDCAMIDLTQIADAQVGDTVTLIGSDGEAQVTAWDMSDWTDAIPYEICTGIGPRVPRITTHD